MDLPIEEWDQDAQGGRQTSLSVNLNRTDLLYTGGCSGVKMWKVSHPCATEQ